MLNLRPFVLAGGLLLTAASGLAAETKLTVPMDYRLIRNVLINQLYTGAGETARVWKDGKDCSFLDLSNPQISGETGSVKIDNNIHARIGINLGGKCMPAFEWSGLLKTLQKPALDAAGDVLSFPVSSATATDANGQQLNINQLQDLINKVVQPKLAELKIDLNQSRNDIIKTLLPFIDANDTEKLQDTVNSLRFKQVQANEKGLQITVGFTGLKQKKSDIKPVAVFNADELQQWQAVWKGWESSLEAALNKPPLAKQAESDKETLREVMQEAGVAFEKGLTEPDAGDNDAVRAFFNDSWDKLAPLLRIASEQMPGAEGLRYLTLIAATDLMYEVEAISSPLGLDISANGLRKLARSYLAEQAGRKKTQ